MDDRDGKAPLRYDARCRDARCRDATAATWESWGANEGTRLSGAPPPPSCTRGRCPARPSRRGRAARGPRPTARGRRAALSWQCLRLHRQRPDVVSSRCGIHRAPGRQGAAGRRPGRARGQAARACVFCRRAAPALPPRPRSAQQDGVAMGDGFLHAALPAGEHQCRSTPPPPPCLLSATAVQEEQTRSALWCASAANRIAPGVWAAGRRRSRG